MRITIAVIAIIINIQVLYCQGSFQRSYGEPGEWANGISAKQCQDGGYIISSTIDGRKTCSNNIYIWLIRTNIFGDTLWTRKFGGLYEKYAGSVIQTNDGGFAVTGEKVDTNGNINILLIKTDTGGNLLWEQTLGWGYYEIGFSLQQTSDGGYIIGGRTETPTSVDIFLIKADSLGNEIWKKKYGQFGSYFDGVKQTFDGGYIIAGITYSDIKVIKTDSAGNVQWSNIYDGPTGKQDVVFGVEQTSDSGYIIAGMVEVFYINTKAYLLKLDVNGNKEWERTFGGPYHNDFRSVHQLNDGGYICGGTTVSIDSGISDVNIWLLRTNPNGDSLWSKTFGGTGEDYAFGMELTNDNGYIIIGNTIGSGLSNVYFIKTDSIGFVQLKANYTINKKVSNKSCFTGLSDNPLNYNLYFNENEISPLQIHSQSYSDTKTSVIKSTFHTRYRSDTIIKQFHNNYLLEMPYTESKNSFQNKNKIKYALQKYANATTFEKWYGTSGWDRAFSAKQCKDGGYIILVGTSGKTCTGNFSNWLIKTNILGDTLWTKVFRGVYGIYPGSVIQTLDGGFAITGTKEMNTFGNASVLLVKTDINGNLLWEKTLGWGWHDSGKSLRQTSDGGFIISGWVDTDTTIDIFLIKADSLGNGQWKSKYGAHSPGTNGLQQTTDGGYIVAGYVWDTLTGGAWWDSRVFKTDSSGAIMWSKQFSISDSTPTGDKNDDAYSVEQTSDGGYIIAGDAQRFFPYPSLRLMAYLLKLDSSGNQEWVRYYGDTNRTQLFSVHQLPDGSHISSGVMLNPNNGGSYDMFLLRTNQNGDSLWSKSYGGTNEEAAYGMELTNDNGYLLYGYTKSFGSGLTDAYLVKTDSMGNVYFPQPAANFTIDSIIFSKAYFTNNSDSAWSYKWYFGDSDSSFLENLSHTYLDTGIYNVTLIAYAGSKSDTITKQLQISEVVGIENLSNANNVDVQIYPNPFTYETKIKYNLPDNTTDAALTIYNIVGEKIEDYKLNDKNGELIIDASDLPQGLYMLYIKNNQGLIRNKKILIIR